MAKRPRGMKRVRTLLVDDERPARQRLRRLLAAHPGVTIVGEVGDGSTALQTIRDLEPDLVFLDIQMPGLDGFGVVAGLDRVAPPAIVFVTAFDEYAVRAFEVHAFDYLLKPVVPERLAQLFARLDQDSPWRNGRDAVKKLDHLLESLGRAPQYLERMLVSEGERSLLVRLDRVSHVEAARNYLTLHAPPAKHLVRGTLGALEARLDPRHWVRVNRSTLVRIDAILQVEPWFHGERHLTLSGGAKVVWSRRYLGRAEEVLGTRL